MHNRAIDRYFKTVNRLHYASRWLHYPCMKFERLDEKLIVLKVESAIETGKFEEIINVIPYTYTEDVRQHYRNVMNKRNYNVNNISAGRTYVAAFTDFISYLISLPSINLGERHHTEY